MAPTLRIGSKDISPFILWGDRQHDFGQPRSPQFGGNVALNDGMPYIRDTASNKEWSLPLWLKPRPSALTNLCTNPKSSTGVTTGWTNVSLPTFETVTLPTSPTAGITTGFHITGDATGDRARFNITVTNGTTYSCLAYVYINSLSATGLLTVVQDSGLVTKSAIQTHTALGQWLCMPFSFTADADDTYQFQVRQTGAGAVDAYFTAVCITQSPAPVDYFDGDSLDASWTGAAGLSSSVAYTGTDGLHAMVRDLNGVVVQGAQVQFKSEGATNVSFFQLERGLTDPHFDLYEDTAGGLRCGLRLWTRPFATSGTTRLLASTLGSGCIQTSIASVAGDTPALMNYLHYGASPVSTDRTFLAFGIAHSASYVAAHPAGSLVSDAAGSVVGAPRQLGSQIIHRYAAAPASGSYDSVVVKDYLTPAAAYSGRWRLFVVGKMNASPAPSLQLTDVVTGSPVTQLISASAYSSASRILVYDLGEVAVPSGPSGIVAPTAGFGLRYYSQGGSAPSGPLYAINSFVYIPADNAGLLVTQNPGALPNEFDLRTGSTCWVNYNSYPQVAAWRGSVTRLDLDLAETMRGAPPAAAPTSGVQQLVAFAGNDQSFTANPATLEARAVERWSYLR